MAQFSCPRPTFIVPHVVFEWLTRKQTVDLWVLQLYQVAKHVKAVHVLLFAIQQVVDVAQQQEYKGLLGNSRDIALPISTCCLRPWYCLQVYIKEHCTGVNCTYSCQYILIYCYAIVLYPIIS